MLVSQLQPHKRLPGGERAENAPLAPVALGGSRWQHSAGRARPVCSIHCGSHTVVCIQWSVVPSVVHSVDRTQCGVQSPYYCVHGRVQPIIWLGKLNWQIQMMHSALPFAAA